MTSTARTAILAVVGLVLAVAVGLAANAISRDSIGLAPTPEGTGVAPRAREEPGGRVPARAQGLAEHEEAGRDDDEAGDLDGHDDDGLVGAVQLHLFRHDPRTAGGDVDDAELNALDAGRARTDRQERDVVCNVLSAGDRLPTECCGTRRRR